MPVATNNNMFRAPQVPRFCLVLVLSLTLSCSAARDAELIGWSESPSDDQPALHRLNPDQQQSSAPIHRGPQPNGGGEKVHGVQVLSWNPRIMLYRGFLTDEETNHVISLADPSLMRSEVVALGGGEEESEVRTSYGTFLDRFQDKIVEEIEKKVAAWTMIPPNNGESMQVLRYEHGQEYKPHHDYIFHDSGNDNGGNRVCTVLMYLSDVEEGGETIFPEVGVPSWQSRATGYSECAMQGMAVKARKGDAVAFWSIGLDGKVDPKVLHGSCPVIKGRKYAATKWLHMANYSMGETDPVRLIPIMYGTSAPPPQPDWCKDDEGECFGWAAVGECERNPGFMIGTPKFPGTCVRACNRCDILGDVNGERPRASTKVADLPNSGEESDGVSAVSWHRVKEGERSKSITEPEYDDERDADVPEEEKSISEEVPRNNPRLKLGRRHAEPAL